MKTTIKSAFFLLVLCSIFSDATATENPSETLKRHMDAAAAVRKEYLNCRHKGCSWTKTTQNCPLHGLKKELPGFSVDNELRKTEEELRKLEALGEIRFKSEVQSLVSNLDPMSYSIPPHNDLCDRTTSGLLPTCWCHSVNVLVGKHAVLKRRYDDITESNCSYLYVSAKYDRDVLFSSLKRAIAEKKKFKEGLDALNGEDVLVGAKEHIRNQDLLRMIADYVISSEENSRPSDVSISLWIR